MPRRRQAVVRKITPDPLFESELVARFICYVMKDGKKAIAQAIVYEALDRVFASLSKGRGKAASGKREGDQGEDGSSGSSGTVGGIKGSERARKIALEKFEEVLGKIGPDVEVCSRRVGGANYQVPVEVRFKRRIILAMRWLRDNARGRSEKTMPERLANEMLDALEGRGGAMKQRENVHRMAKANQVFSHYRY